jgi:hypothetical protein
MHVVVQSFRLRNLTLGDFLIAFQLDVFINLFSLRIVCTTENIDLPLLGFLNIWLMDYPNIHQPFKCRVSVLKRTQLVLFI